MRLAGLGARKEQHGTAGHHRAAIDRMVADDQCSRGSGPDRRARSEEQPGVRLLDAVLVGVCESVNEVRPAVLHEDRSKVLGHIAHDAHLYPTPIELAEHGLGVWEGEPAGVVHDALVQER